MVVAPVTKFLKLLEHRHVKPWLRSLEPWQRVRYGDVRVHYQRHLDGGGSSFGQDYIPFFLDRGMPRQLRVFEWCAGPGFIGFSMLAYGLCETLCLADVNSEAVDACRRTVRDNGLSERVSVYCSDNLRDIPPSEQWDLVVGNPPHFDGTGIAELRYCDEDWRLHRAFFASVGRFLKPGGVIMLQENNQGSTVETFRHMIEESGFSIVSNHGCRPERTPYFRCYYIGIVRRGDTAPSWVTTMAT